MLTDPALKSKVDALWDRFWSGGIANPITATEQMYYLIFLKRLEEFRPPVVPLPQKECGIFDFVRGTLRPVWTGEKVI